MALEMTMLEEDKRFVEVDADEQTDLKAILKQMDNNYGLLKNIAARHNTEDIAVIRILEHTFKDNVRKAYRCIKTIEDG